MNESQIEEILALKESLDEIAEKKQPSNELKEFAAKTSIDDVKEYFNKDEVPVLPEKFEDAVPEYTKKEQYSPEDLAATFFKMQAPKLSRLLQLMSAKQLRRIIFNVVSFPLIDTKYAPRDQQEKDCVYLMTEMVFNRSIMTLTVEMQKAEKAMQTPQEDVSMGKPVLEELIEKELNKENV